MRKTNDLLHGQIQSLGAQVDRLVETKTNLVLNETSSSATSTSTAVDTTTTTTTADATTAAAAGTTNVNADEITELRQTSSELREVIRYIKRERDILDAKLTVKEQENVSIKHYTYICVSFIELNYLYYPCSHHFICYINHFY